MIRSDVRNIVFFLALTYYIVFRIKIKCPECGNEIKTMTYTQVGLVWLFMRGTRLAYDLATGGSVDFYLETLLLTPAFYYLSSEPKFFCRHCMKGISFSKEYIVK